MKSHLRNVSGHRSHRAASRFRERFGVAWRPKGDAPSAHQLFDELDGHEIRTDDGPVPLEVFSVCDQGGHRWVQVGFHGHDPGMLILEVPASEPAQRVVETIASLVDHGSAVA